MNYAPYDLQTHPANQSKPNTGNPTELPTNPEELPELEYPSREEPGEFYANEAERVADNIDRSDEQLDTEREVKDGVEAASGSTADMDFEDAQLEQPYEAGFDGLPAHSGPGLRH